jgi:hypothetical protein
MKRIFLVIIITLSCALSCLAQAKPFQAELRLSVSNELLGYCPSAAGTAWSENYLFNPWAGCAARIEGDFRLWDRWLISPSAEVGVSRSTLYDADIGCGLGFVALEGEKWRLDILAMPFYGIYSQASLHQFFGGRVEAAWRFDLFWKIKGVVSAGVEWRTDFLCLPVSLGFSL